MLPLPFPACLIHAAAPHHCFCPSGAVFRLDLRLPIPREPFFHVPRPFGSRSGSSFVALNSIALSPRIPHQLAAAGDDPVVRIFDLREVRTAVGGESRWSSESSSGGSAGGGPNQVVFLALGPAALRDFETMSVTCVAYSYSGREVRRGRLGKLSQ